MVTDLRMLVGSSLRLSSSASVSASTSESANRPSSDFSSSDRKSPLYKELGQISLGLIWSGLKDFSYREKQFSK